MDEVTIKAYNELADVYDEETRDFWARFPSTIIDRFAKETRGKVLDVGSGPGRDGLLLKDRGFEVIGVDASEKMVALSTAAGLPSVVGDFSALPFSDDTFDGAWAYTSLLHVPKHEIDVPLREIRRVLKAGGTLALGLVEGAWEGYRESSEMHQSRWFSYYKKEEVEGVLERYGFTIVHFEQFKPKSKNYLNFIAKKQHHGAG